MLLRLNGLSNRCYDAGPAAYKDPAATIEEVTLAASSLAALPGAGYAEAAQTLKAVAEKATRRRPERGVA